MKSNTAWTLASRPVGQPEKSNFQWIETALPELGEGEVLVRTIWLSLDPTNRAWMNDVDGYMPSLKLGEVMRGIALGRVEESRSPAFAAGDMVQGMLGWQRYYVGSAKGLTKLPPIPLPLSAHFGLLGHIGLTAYFGVTEVGQAKAGETMVVTTAAGAVGSLAAQIGKIMGLRVVGIAGGAEKCRWLTEELGLDAAIDYKSEDVGAALDRECPGGIDVDFENVGGAMLDAILARINIGARIALCGLISQYNASRPVPGPYQFANLLVRRGRVQGFIVLDYLHRAEEAARQLIAWHMEGKLKYRLDVAEGLEQAPAALLKLFDGRNTGKLLVRVGQE
ncbi:MAG: NADP-dependent oxidoreductase [Candidatus Solibacter usitatus]|nr:NADP-dependent oxidoreductase [Candidatus Solibacter usitatus]